MARRLATAGGGSACSILSVLGKWWWSGLELAEGPHTSRALLARRVGGDFMPGPGLDGGDRLVEMKGGDPEPLRYQGLA